jgi:hypothetical protein
MAAYKACCSKFQIGNLTKICLKTEKFKKTFTKMVDSKKNPMRMICIQQSDHHKNLQIPLTFPEHACCCFAETLNYVQNE